ncbi:conserved exported protein of unknown function [Tenacibaculum sp. 190524A02b]|uniref:hypothetical protein n=1 Tax=Tenacibaculum vairaonense TaxID=3137860 RepID=UPI0032B21724
MKKVFFLSAALLTGLALMSFDKETNLNDDNSSEDSTAFCTINHKRYATDSDGTRYLVYERVESCDGKYVIRYIHGTGPTGRISEQSIRDEREGPEMEGVEGEPPTEKQSIQAPNAKGFLNKLLNIGS